MLCAIPRKAPISAYPLLDAQPASSNGYKLSPITANKSTQLCEASSPSLGVGAKLQINKARPIAILGAKVNKRALTREGNKGSLVKSLMASANGCAAPAKDTLLGPLRSWLSPRILRSISVKNATLTKTGTIISTAVTVLLQMHLGSTFAASAQRST